MAGSYNHVVKKDGSLNKPDRVCGMLECSSNDVYEAVEEMYGMIWFLASEMARTMKGETWEPETFVEEARKNYKFGLSLSPTKRFKE